MKQRPIKILTINLVSLLTVLLPGLFLDTRAAESNNVVDSAVGTIKTTELPIPLKITIIEPVDLSTVSSVVNIYGSYVTDAPYTTISMVAPHRYMSGSSREGNFYMNAVRLVPGNNEITVRGVDSYSNEAITTINVFVEDTPAPTISMDFESERSLPLYDEQLKITLSNLEPVQGSAVMEYQGPKGVTITKINDTEYTLNFTTVGFYRLTYSVEDINGNTHSTTAYMDIGELPTEEEFNDMEARGDALTALYRNLRDTHDFATVRQLVFEAAQNDPALVDVELSQEGLSYSYKNRTTTLMWLFDPNEESVD